MFYVVEHGPVEVDSLGYFTVRDSGELDYSVGWILDYESRWGSGNTKVFNRAHILKTLFFS